MGNNNQPDLEERTTVNNPFVFDRPVGPSDLFISRENALSWVSDNLQTGKRRSLTINGAVGIGKTTFLIQVQKQADHLGIIPFYVNLNQVPLNSFSEFLWAFGKTVVRGLTDNGHPAPLLEKRMLVLRPWQAFEQWFWRPLVEEYGGQRFLLILDNFECLTTKSTFVESNLAYRQYLYELTEQSPDMLVLTSLAGRTEGYNPDNLAPFHQSLTYRIPPFSESQNFNLIRQNRLLIIQQSTAAYIHSLTKGHPADTQRLCHAIFERMQGFNFKVITVADVVSTLRSRLKPTDFRWPVHYQRGKVANPKQSG